MAHTNRSVFEARPTDLDGFVADWNDRTGRDDDRDGILHYMRNERKCGRWVKLGSNHEPSPPRIELSAEETESLVAIYQVNVADQAIGSDNIAYSQEIADLIADEFARLTGRVVPTHHLIGKLTALRKRGLLPKACEHEPDVTLKKRKAGA